VSKGFVRIPVCGGKLSGEFTSEKSLGVGATINFEAHLLGPHIWLHVLESLGAAIMGEEVYPFYPMIVGIQSLLIRCVQPRKQKTGKLKLIGLGKVGGA